MHKLGRNRYLFGKDVQEQERNEEAFKRAYAVLSQMTDVNNLSTMRPVTQDLCSALVGKEGPPLEPLKIPDVLTWDVQTGMPVLHISFILNHFLPRRHISRIYSLWTLHRLQTHLLDEFSDTPEIVPELAGSMPEGFAVPPHNPRSQFSEGANIVPLEDVAVQCSDSDLVLVAVTKLVSLDRDSSTRFFMETDHCYPGYCRLVATNPELTDPSFLVDKPSSKNKYLNGNVIVETLFQGVLSKQQSEGEIVRHGPAVTHLPINRFRTKRIEVDFVFALPCTEWPAVTKKWLDRPTKTGWPSKDFKKELIAEGCLVVCVPHRTSRWREVEWRISFSRAERALANSLTDIHRQCYILLKVLVKGILEPGHFITSYHLKTLLFWTCERLPQDLWQKDDSSLGICFLALLDELLHVLINHNLPHYFYTDNNLFSHIAPDFMQDICKKIIWLRRNVVEAIFQFDVSHVFACTPRAFELSSLLRPLAVEAEEPYEDKMRAYASYTRVLQLLSKAVLANGNVDDMIDYTREACQIQQVIFGKDPDFITLVITMLSTLNIPPLLVAVAMETILRRFPSKRNIPWISSNLACEYHSFFHTKKFPNDQVRVLARAEILFKEAVSLPDATAATWADYANFLYKQAAPTSDILKAVDKVVNLSLDDTKQLCNTFDEVEMPSLPDEVAEDIRQDGDLTVPSAMYALYLAVITQVRDGNHVEGVAERIVQMKELLSKEDDPGLLFSSYKLLGLCFVANGDFSNATEAFEKVLQIKASSTADEYLLLCAAMKLSLGE